MFHQAGALALRGLEGHDAPGRPDKFGSDERVQTRVRADVEHRHAGLYQRRKRAALAPLERAGEQAVADGVVPREPPETRRHAQRKRKVRESPMPDAAETLALLAHLSR